MQEKVWEASGHLGCFTDPLIKCGKCNAVFRVDTLINEKLPEVTFDPSKHEELLKIIKDNLDSELLIFPSLCFNKSKLVASNKICTSMVGRKKRKCSLEYIEVRYGQR